MYDNVYTYGSFNFVEGSKSAVGEKSASGFPPGVQFEGGSQIC